ncbi:chorion peroxidase-like isoform X4 [Eriocheir sinensis]|uniref:chorion peroxidase-like isoform X4 n=2 Tax=Eriocheir sinensis TaxID=95602 RepID=UPI0021C96E8D|nr:chorion peroxidase-like isoform X4 [Eriocheir sinensis]
MKAFLMVAAVVGVVAGQIKFPGECVCMFVQVCGKPGGGGGACDCQPISVCAISFDSVQANCQLGDGSEGVCCPQESADAAAARPAASAGAEAGMVNVNVRTQFTEPLVPVSQSELATASQAGTSAVSSLATLEQSMVQENRFVRRGTPASGHLHQSRISQGARNMDKRAWAIVQASTSVMGDLNLAPRASGLGLRNVLVSESPLRDQCPTAVSCGNPSSKFRTADGSCNNQANPEWGKSNTPAQRVLPPTYDDGLVAFRTLARDGSRLPNPRNISSTILVDIDKPDATFTLSVMQWAQFMDHDFAHIPFPSLPNNEGIECCSSDPNFPKHPRCMPIDLTGDRFYSQFGRTCMNFVRSMLAVGPGRACTFGFAEQLNQLTHWIDGSMVYGSSDEEQRSIRTMQNGLLSTSAGNMLPFNPNQGGECEAGLRNAKCFLAGESRVNEQPSLTAMHTLWMREHNRVATALQRFNPQWNDEQVYQEARRIVVAEIQHITFNEWLPIIVGPRFVRAFGLTVRRRGFSNDYNPTINPNMNNEFSTAAFRFGHSLVQGTLALFSQNGQVSTVQLRNNFNSPHLIQNEGRFDDLVRSLVQFPSQTFDNFVTSDLSNHLFQTPEFRFGMDLMSLNIHRGRDHGIATYNSIREVCGLRRARDFADLQDQIIPRIIQRLQSLYRSVDDIDLFVGGMSETPLRRSLLGWTFTCLVGDQFARLKKGDRFFYDLGGQAGSFTEPQLNQVRRTSWARILCDNSELAAVQPLAFQLPTHRFNRPRPCNSFSIPQVDLSAWRN